MYIIRSTVTTTGDVKSLKQATATSISMLACSLFFVTPTYPIKRHEVTKVHKLVKS